MSGDPLRDLDGAARIHVFGDAHRTTPIRVEHIGRNMGQSRAVLSSETVSPQRPAGVPSGLA
jgi:hypothetical protein